jgi:hypothetical protein
MSGLMFNLVLIAIRVMRVIRYLILPVDIEKVIYGASLNSEQY